VVTPAHPSCIYCGLPVPISDNSDYTLLKLDEGEYQYAHLRCADSAARDPLEKPPIQSISVGKSRKDCA